MIVPSHHPTNEEIARHYDSLGEFYREVWGNDLHHGYWEKGNESTEGAVQNLTSAVADLAGISKGDEVCDVGSGYGGTAIRLASVRTASVTGWTLSLQQHSIAEGLADDLPGDIPKPAFHRQDWMENTIADQTFDSVISIECLSHLLDKVSFFQEAAPVLRPGGRIAIADWTVSSTPRRWHRKFLLEPMCEEGRLAGLLDANELRSAIESAGLEVTELREIGTSVRRTWSIITQRLCRKVLSDGRYRRFLFENLKSERIFALTILRLLIAYRTRSLQYILVGAVKPISDQSSFRSPADEHG